MFVPAPPHSITGGELLSSKVKVMRILPIAGIACGLVLTAAWVCFLGFEIFKAVELMF
jgi:hypothetical protein